MSISIVKLQNGYLITCGPQYDEFGRSRNQRSTQYAATSQAELVRLIDELTIEKQTEKKVNKTRAA